jgi:hypothetical protein
VTWCPAKFSIVAQSFATRELSSSRPTRAIIENKLLIYDL